MGRELDENPFVRAWRGEAPGTARCTAFERPALWMRSSSLNVDERRFLGDTP